MLLDPPPPPPRPPTAGEPIDFPLALGADDLPAVVLRVHTAPETSALATCHGPIAPLEESREARAVALVEEARRLQRVLKLCERV